jgi:hypothetical protein
VYLQCSEPVPVYLYPSIGFGTWFPWGGFGPLYSEAYFVPYMTEYDGQITGRLKVKVKPRTARVFVDGFYVGIVDEFDGALQKLTLNGGAHKIVISADGYETIELDVYISYTRTVTIVREMKRVP